MAKFTFDAIGRDLFPAERAAAKVFLRSYANPQNNEDVKRQMRTVRSRVEKAVVEGKSFTTAFYAQVKREGRAPVKKAAPKLVIVGKRSAKSK